MKRRMLAGYLIALHLLLGLVLWKSDFISRVRTKLTGEPVPEELGKHFRDMRRYHARSAQIVPEGSVFFIGDSIIQGLCVEAVTRPAVNYGIGGDTTAGVLERMGDYDFSRASAVVLCIGGNDLKYRTPEAAAANVEQILARINPGLPVVLSANLLTDESARENLRGRNAAITAFNRLLEHLAATQAPHVIFVEHPNLTGSGNLKPDLHDGDGVHPNSNGNHLLAENFRAALNRIQHTAAPGGSSPGR